MTGNEIRRSRPIQKLFWVDEDENQIIKNQMEQAGIDNFSVYARLMMMTGEVKVIDFSILDSLRKEINRIGVNVNQIAKYVNTNEMVTHQELANVFSELKTVEELIHQTIKSAEKGEYNFGSD